MIRMVLDIARLAFTSHVTAPWIGAALARLFMLDGTVLRCLEYSSDGRVSAISSILLIASKKVRETRRWGRVLTSDSCVKSNTNTILPQSVRPFAKKLYGKRAMEMSQAELYAFFLTRVRSNLHIVLAFSPIGDAFRDRLRKFPSLINCCVIGVFASPRGFSLVDMLTRMLVRSRVIYMGGN